MNLPGSRLELAARLQTRRRRHRREVSVGACLLALVVQGTDVHAAACLDEAFGGKTLCNRDDIEALSIDVTRIRTGCSGSGTFSFDGDLYFLANTGGLEDVAFYMGIDAQSSTDGDCTVVLLPPFLGDTDEDACGDVPEAGLIAVPVGNITLPCIDSDGDGFFDVNLCVSWREGDPTTCNDAGDATPSSKFSCNCAAGSFGDDAVCTMDPSFCSLSSSCGQSLCLGKTTGLTDQFGCACVLAPTVQSEGQRFGQATALSDDLFVVSAPNAFGPGIGRVHLFDILPSGGSNEVLQSNPIAVPLVDLDHPASETGFGAAVDADGDTVVVGAPNDVVPTGQTFSTGSASVFVRNGSTWDFQAKLIDSSGTCDELGSDVAIDGDTVVLGAPGGDCALVFHREGTSWSLAAQLSEGVPGNHFGKSVDVSGDAILVGAPRGQAGSSCAGPGSVYAFRRLGATWPLEDEIVEQDPSSDSCFGASVSLADSIGAVGAPGDNASTVDGGAVYVIERGEGNWAVVDQLLPSPPPIGMEAPQGFGSEVEFSDNRILASAPGSQVVLFERSGAAALATRSAIAWDPKRTYSSPDASPTSDDGFGDAIAISPNKAFVGVPGRDVNGIVDAGSVFDGGSIRCGDGIVAPGEEVCDDGNTIDGDGCGNNCRLTGCGDSVVAGAEDCDNGEANGGAGSCCDANCGFVAAATVCRPANGECDIAETCSGSASSCPADGVQAAGIPCTADGDVCTDDECDGAGTCTHDFDPSNGPACVVTTTTLPTTTTTTTTLATTTTLVSFACGDPNGDGKILAGDALVVLATAVGNATCDPCLCDVNSSGDILASDALAILRSAVGLEVNLVCVACGAHS